MTNIAKTIPTMQEIKFAIGRFPNLFENVYLKRFLDHDKILEEKTLSILATIEKIQENCNHEFSTGWGIFIVMKKIQDKKCAHCGKSLEN